LVEIGDELNFYWKGKMISEIETEYSDPMTLISRTGSWPFINKSVSQITGIESPTRISQGIEAPERTTR
jgi:hypothetical protein